MRTSQSLKLNHRLLHHRHKSATIPHYPFRHKPSGSSNQPFQINHNIFLNPRYYRLFALGSFAFLLAFLASAILTPVSTSSAIDPATSTISVSNKYNGRYLNFAAGAALDLNISAVPEGTISAVTDNLSIATNVGTGYKLSLSVQDPSGAPTNNIYNTADIDKVSNHFSPVDGTIESPSTLGTNTWGFKLATIDSKPDADITWSAVPTEPTLIKETNKATPETGETIPISYGFSVDTTLPAGTYQAEILYTVYAEYAEEFPTMQDFTIEDCNNMQTNEITTLTDSRDGKSYRITKYADNNCWMSQNLALDGTDAATGQPRTLTSADTNLDATEIPSGEITFPAGTDITSGESKYDTPQIYTLDQNKTTTTCQYDSCVPSDEPYGNYYNWNAATAMQGKEETTAATTIRSSVCPKGWRLPDNGTATGAKTYANLVGKYTVNMDGTGDQMPTVNTENVTAAVKRIQQAPLYFSLAGGFTSNILFQGMIASYWSRTVSSSSTRAHSVLFDSRNGDFTPQDNSEKLNGKTVRCVFEGAIEDNMSMQDVTIDMCNNLDESTATTDNRKTLIDIRDNKTYRVSKLADGNCWMVQNLALDPIDTNGNNRTLTTADTNINTTEIPSGEYTFPDNTLIPSGTQSTAAKEQIYNADATKTTTSCGTYAYCDPNNNELYGNYYNWMSATLGIGTTSVSTGEVYSSVCPKGWRLPTSGTAEAYGANAPDKSYGKLMYSTLGFTLFRAAYSSGGTYSKQSQQSPLYFPLAGNYAGSSGMLHEGQNSVYWSRRVPDGNATNAYNLYLDGDSGNFYPQYDFNKQYGYPVRCVLGE